ncbi:MAG: DUF922 domain-containing protein [Pseudomonadota bacterium]
MLHRAIFLIVTLIVFAFPAHAQLKITERTKHYTIKGKTAPDFAKSMSKRGPYSRSKRQRAWATAGRKLSFQVLHRKVGGRCVVRGARVDMRITTTLPKLRRLRGVSKNHAKRWQRMSGLLQRHEAVHVRYYRQLAKQTHRALLRLKPAKSCRALDQKAKRVVEDLARKDTARNRRFDMNDRRNYRRMSRLYRGV